ncbi:MAG TPA: hypothetical protein VJY39_11535, partial [Acidisphaera sp.]|nr:hypothetical protein [Acidisphaera sp.]
SELVVATALRQRLPEFLLNTDQTNIFAKFIAERQDTNKMQTFHLAASTEILGKSRILSTSISHTWWVTCLRRDGHSCYDESERFHEVDPATLTMTCDESFAMLWIELARTRGLGTDFVLSLHRKG